MLSGLHREPTRVLAEEPEWGMEADTVVEVLAQIVAVTSNHSGVMQQVGTNLEEGTKEV